MPPRKRTTAIEQEDTRRFDTPEQPNETVSYTKATLAELLAEGEAAAYARGHAAGLVEAVKPPLFEACKQAAERYWVSENDQQLRARFDALEAEYGETVTFQDRELILGGARRNRIADRATEMALEDLTRPRRKPRAVVVDREITV